MRPSVPEVVVAGAACRDVDRADPRGWRLGGAVCYVSLALGRLGLRVGACIGLDHHAAQAEELELLRDAGVEVRSIPLHRGPVFDNHESVAGRVQICVSEGGRMPAASLPEGWDDACGLVLAPVAGELDDAWADAVPRARLVALGWQGVLRRLRSGERTVPLSPRMSPLVARANLVAVSRDDIAGSGAGDPLGVLIGAADRQVAVTAGRKGGLLLWREGGLLRARRYPALPARAERDPTGSGDAFLAGWVAGVIARGIGASAGRDVDEGRSPNLRALRLAAIVAALKVEGRGLGALPDRATVAARLRELSETGAAGPPGD